MCVQERLNSPAGEWRSQTGFQLGSGAIKAPSRAGGGSRTGLGRKTRTLYLVRLPDLFASQLLSGARLSHHSARRSCPRTRPSGPPSASGTPEWTTHAAALEEGNSLRENRRLSRPQFDTAGRFAKVRGSSFAPLSQLGSCVANALVFELADQHPGSLCRSGRSVEECATQVQPRRLPAETSSCAKDRAGKDERCTAVFR
jgi:hypothetical protein